MDEVPTQSMNCTVPQMCKSCLVLLVANLAEPYWTSVDCDAKLATGALLCSLERKHEKKALQDCLERSNSRPLIFTCNVSHIQQSEKCFNFLWVNLKFSGLQKCNNNFSAFIEVFGAVAASKVPHIITPRPRIKFTQIVRSFNFFEYGTTFINDSSAKGFCILSERTHRYTGKSMKNLFDCGENTFISIQSLCDKKYDCPGKKYELDFKCEINEKMKKKLNNFFAQKNDSGLCLPIFNTSDSGLCVPYHFTEDKPVKTSQSEKFECLNRQWIFEEFVNDLVADCLPSGQDEPLLKFVTENKAFDFCEHKYQIPCRDGHSMCFNVSDICKYSLDKHGHLLSCRTGEHLQKCRLFECGILFKCISFYCISWKNICDGQWDCPEGADEFHVHHCGRARKCKNLFKCRNSNTCVAVADVCDSKLDCPEMDDEDSCLLLSHKCPPFCNCLAHAIMCTNSSHIQHELKAVFKFKIVHLLSCIVASLHNYKLRNVIVLSIQNAQLETVCVNSLFASTNKQVNFAGNLINQLDAGCFKKANKAVSLYLNENKLTDLKMNVFEGLLQLRTLNISNNPLVLLEGKTSSVLPVLSLISLLSIVDLQIADNVFQDSKLEMLQSSSYLFCCLLPSGSLCLLEIPWFVGCSDIIPSAGNTIAFYVFSCAILVTNIVFLVFQRGSQTTNEKTSASNHIEAAVSISDGFSTLPLFCLWIADITYSQNYILQETVWKRSFPCLFTHCSSLFFHLLSPTLLCLMSYSRFSVVKYPMESSFKVTKTVRNRLLSVYLACVTVSMLMTFLTWLVDVHLLENEMPLSLCSPFLDPAKKAITVQIFTWMIAILDWCSLLFILVTYIKLYTAFEESKANVSASSSKQQSSTPLLVQLSVIFVTNVVCWITNSIIFLCGLYLSQYPMELMTWTVVSIVPLNSLVNPLVFIFTTTRKLLRK